MPNFHVILFLHKQTPNLNVHNLTFQKRNPTSFSSHGKSPAPLQCSWKRSHGLWPKYPKTHAHPKHNRPPFLQSYICGLQPVCLLLRFAFFCHGVSFLSTSTPRVALTTPKYRTWFVTLQFSEWNVPLKKFEIAFFFPSSRKFKLEANQVNVSLYYTE